MTNVLSEDIKSSKDSKDKKCSDEFQKLRNLALELKNMQLKILKDLNKKEFIK